MAVTLAIPDPAYAQNLESFASKVRGLLSSTLLRTLAVIPPIIGTKIVWFSNRFFKRRALPPPEVPALSNQTIAAALPTLFRDLTDDEAAGNLTRPVTQDDILTEDCPSFFADILTLDQDGKVSGLIEEGDENE
jgi:hypothetical protein